MTSVGGLRNRALLLGLFSLAAGSQDAAADNARGTLAPEIKLDGGDPEGACTFVAQGKDQTFESASGNGIEVPPGAYEVRVECKDEDASIVPGLVAVQVAAGKIAAPKVDVRTARIRVEARRNGIMLPARVKLFSAGEHGDTKPLVELAANQKLNVAQGRYDVVITLDDPKSPRAEVLFEKTAIGSRSLTVLQADLSDGGLIVAATANGKKASALVRVFAGKGGGKDVGQAEAGEEVRLPAGRYLASTELRDTSDFATKKREVWIKAGKVLKISEAFETGSMNVTVERDGRPVAATVRVSLPGAGDFFNHFSAPGTIVLSPGAYDVSIVSEALGPLKPPSRTGLKVTKGQTTRVPFDLTPGTLVVKLTKGGQTADGEIHVREAGGGDEVATDVSGRFRLWPGRYEIIARLEDGEEILDGPFEMKLGEKVTRAVSVVRGTLTVIATRGESPAGDAEVLVFKPGATKPVAKGRSGARFEVSPGTYDVKVVSGVEVAWKEGVKLKKTALVRVPLLSKRGKEEALPEGDLSAPSDDLPEGEEPAAKEPPRSDAAAGDGDASRDAGGAPKDAGRGQYDRDSGRPEVGVIPELDASMPDGGVPLKRPK